MARKRKPTAAERALAAMAEHGKLVRNKTWHGSWQTPDLKWPPVCGTVTIMRLIERGQVELVPDGDVAMLIKKSCKSC